MGAHEVSRAPARLGTVRFRGDMVCFPVDGSPVVAVAPDRRRGACVHWHCFHLGVFRLPLVAFVTDAAPRDVAMTRELVYTGFMTLDGVVDSPGSQSEGHRSGGLGHGHRVHPRRIRAQR